MASFSEKILKRFTNLFCCQHNNLIILSSTAFFFVIEIEIANTVY